MWIHESNALRECESMNQMLYVNIALKLINYQEAVKSLKAVTESLWFCFSCYKD
jgi:hypothetical protein